MESVRISHATGRSVLVGLGVLAGAALLVLACDTAPTGWTAEISVDNWNQVQQPGYTHIDDFASNTAASYQSYSLAYGGGSATASIGYDPASRKATLTGTGGYADLVMKPTDAPAIQPGQDFSFSYDVSVLSEYTGMIYLGDLQGYSSGTWLRFGLDTYGHVVLAYVIVDGFERDVHSEATSATGGTIKVARMGSSYTFYFNGGEVWSGAIPELDGVTLYVGANARVSSGS
jgi:hypothetical protein